MARNFSSFAVYTDTPNCSITREDVDGEDRLNCVADGNPEVYDYVWDFKSENETGDDNLEFKKNNRKSYLVLSDDVHQKRVYRCRANNTVGVGMFCEISVEGELVDESFMFVFVSL